MPLALEVLEKRPLAAGAYYPGDLLERVLSLGPDVWALEAEWRSRTRGILAQIRKLPEELNDAVDAFRTNAA
jgi:hypothetical protein